VTVKATALTTPTLVADGFKAEQTGSLFTLTVLPGLHDFQGPGGTGLLYFTVNNDGTVSVGGNGNSYASSIASVSNGNQLTVNGAAVTVNATALTTATLVLDNQTPESTSMPFPAQLLPGLHLLSNASGSVTFSIDDNGNISFPASEDALLSLQGNLTLIVKAL
jgi:hypothetical protein